LFITLPCICVEARCVYGCHAFWSVRTSTMIVEPFLFRLSLLPFLFHFVPSLSWLTTILIYPILAALIPSYFLLFFLFPLISNVFWPSGFDQKQREYLGFQHWVDCSFFTVLIPLSYYKTVYRSLFVLSNLRSRFISNFCFLHRIMVFVGQSE